MKQTVNTTDKDVLPDKLALFVTGSGKRTDELTNNLILRTDDATLHFNKNSEFGKLAHALIDRYNERQKLLDSNRELLKLMEMVEAGVRTKQMWAIIPNGVIHKQIQTAINNAKNIVQ